LNSGCINADNDDAMDPGPISSNVTHMEGQKSRRAGIDYLLQVVCNPIKREPGMPAPDKRSPRKAFVQSVREHRETNDRGRPGG
jgi:hypothetical protein